MGASARTTGIWVIVRSRATYQLAPYYCGRSLGMRHWSSDPKAAQVFRTKTLAEKTRRGVGVRGLEVIDLQRTPATQEGR